MNLSLVIEQYVDAGGILFIERCLVLDQDGCPVGELPITEAVQVTKPSEPVVTTISTYRARIQVADD